MKKHADSIDAAILARIRSGPKDRVWMPAEFLDLGSRAAVDKALSRNSKSALICRAGRGMNHLPRHDPFLGVLGPSYDGLQDFIRRKARGKVFPTGAHAANARGLRSGAHAAVALHHGSKPPHPPRQISDRPASCVATICEHPQSEKRPRHPRFALDWETLCGRRHHRSAAAQSGPG